MNTFCDGNCSSCPFAEAGSREKKAINVAVTSTYANISDETVTFGDYCVRFTFVGADISSILDIKPDVVLQLVDATDLESTIYPATKLIDMELKVVLALEKYNALLATGHSIAYKTLGKLTDFYVIPADFSTERGKRVIFDRVIKMYEFTDTDHHKVRVPYGQDVEKAISAISREIAAAGSNALCVSERYMALRLLEDESYIMPYVESLENAVQVVLTAEKYRSSLFREFGRTSSELVREGRRGFIKGALQETLRHGKDSSDHTVSQRIDSILTNRWLGLPLLIAILFGVFQATFSLGAYPQRWIENGIALLSGWMGETMASGWFSSMLIDGVIQGVGAVLAFLPNIIIMFFFLSLLEDCGYMHRAAYVMDKIMHAIGLHGRSFVPMLMGFGCNVPAIMAARSIEDRKDRTLTMLMIPFMSCSARLPVYLMLVAAFFPRHKALVLMGLYLTGILLSILFGFIMKRTRFFRKKTDDYVSELPDFRIPTWRNTGLHIWDRTKDYLQKITTVILAASVIIWALEYFPRERPADIPFEESSYLSAIGKACEPVFQPLGFDWKMDVCLLTGLPAKEAIVSTTAILKPDFTPQTAMAFMLFVLLYFPCIATVATLRREIGRRWAAFTVVNSLALAWIVGFIAFRLALLL